MNEHRTTSPSRGVLRIVLFFGLFIGLLYLIDFGVRQGLRRHRTSAFGVSNRVMDGKANAEILVSGSSRALTHYDSRIIQQVTGRSTFNIGRNGSQTDMQVAYLKAYLRNNTPPKLVVHNLDLYSFLTSHEIYDAAQYLPYLNEESIFQGIRRVYPDAWKWRRIPLYGYLVEDMRFTWIYGLLGLTGWQPKEDQHGGFLPRYREWTGEFDDFRRKNPKGVRFGMEAQGIKDLTEIAEICHQRGIPLLFVYSPEYYEMVALELDRPEIFAEFKVISERYGISIWDYTSSDISRNQQNFYNSQHLNATGAELFTKDFAERLTKSEILRK